MASQFYNRYILPVTIDTYVHASSRPSKKRKKLKSKSKINLPAQQVLTQPNAEEDAAEQSRNASESVSQKATSEPVARHDLPTRDKHQTVFTKFERAAKKPADVPKDVEDQPLIEQSPDIAVESHGLEPLPQPPQSSDPPKVSAFSVLPEWLRNPVIVSSADEGVLFNSLPINKKTVSTLQSKDYETAFAIQSAVLAMCLPGPSQHQGDICISAATGSGKTLAYTLPMIEALRDKPVTKLRGLIIVPTRELVNQVMETLDLCSSGSRLKIGTAVGSKSLREEQALLIQKGQKYDPEGYRAESEKDVDEDEQLMDWDFEKRFGPQNDVQVYYNHVIEYTSKVDILVCTPGRLVEHIESTTGFTLHDVQWLVIDEADRLLDESFQQWIDVVIPGLEYIPLLDALEERIFSHTFHLLRRREIRKIVLSATMTRDVSKLTALKLRHPKLVVLEGYQADVKVGNDLTEIDVEAGERIELPSTLLESGLKVPEINDKPLYLIRLLDRELNLELPTANETDGNPMSSHSEESELEDSSSISKSEDNTPQSIRKPAKVDKKLPAAKRATTHGTLIFTNTNEHATRLARLLSLTRPDWAPKIGTLTKSSASSKGRKTLTSFQKGKLNILIASDRASRGLDIPNLAHVINYDMPTSLTSYIHRVGRTARAGKEGRATTLIASNEARWFWNEIARSEKVGRRVGRRVGRDNGRYEFGEDERRVYERALEAVGKEARG